MPYDSSAIPSSGPVGGLKTEPYPGAAAGWLATAILCFLYVLSFVDRNIMVLLAEPVAREMGLSDFQLGLLYGPAFAIIFALAGLPLGWAIDRFSRRAVIWFGVTVWSVMTMSCGLATSFPLLFGARAGVGAGEAVLVPGSQSIIADMFPPDRLALPLSIYGLGGKVGGGLSFVLGGLLLTLISPESLYDVGFLRQIKGWQLIFIVAGLPGLLLAFAIFLIPEPPRRSVRAPAEGKQIRFRDYLRFATRNFRFIGCHHLAIVLVMIVMTGMSTWAPSYFSRVHLWSSHDTGYRLGIVMMCGPIVGIPLHGLLADRLFRSGRRDAHLSYLKMMLAIGVIPGVAAFLVPNAWLSLGLIGVFMAITVGYIGLLPTALQCMVPGDMRGKAASIALLVGSMGGMTLGPMLVAILTESVYQRPEMVGISIATCIGLIVPVAVVALGFAQKPMREAWGSQERPADAGANT